MRRFLISAALCALATSAQAQAPSRAFSPKDLFALQQAGDTQIRPDGGEVAYVRTTYDIMTDKPRHSIWLVDVASGAQQPMDGAAGEGEPRWSPDGRRLAYVAAGPQGKPQLHVRWMASGASAAMTDLPEGPDDLAWSPDGRSIAFSMLVTEDAPKLGAPMDKPEGAKWAEPLKIITRVHYREDNEGYLKPGYRHLFIVPADGGAPRQLSFGDYDDGGPIRFTPDGRTLVFVSEREKGWQLDTMNSELFRLSLDTGALTALTHRVGPDQEPALSPDGKRIAWVGFDDHLRGYENSGLYVMDLQGGTPKLLTAGFDRSLGHPEWARDGRSVYVNYTDHGVTEVAEVGMEGQVRPLVAGLGGSELDRPYSGGDYSVSDNGTLAFTYGDAATPADVAISRGGGAPRRLTSLNAELFSAVTLAKVTPLAVTSTYDKRAIDAWVMTPPGFDPARKYPLVLEVHGGPFASYGPNFASELQLYAAAGYVVLYVNPRGSTSYGAEFADLIDRNYPSQDYDDLMSAVDTVIARGFVDPDDLFVTGGSGGGALTAWIVGKTARFKAAVSQKPVIDWTSEVLTTDGYEQMAKYWFGKMPWEDPMGYWRRSPLSLVGAVTTPTMLMVGEEDHRTPPSEAEQEFDALQLRGVPTALIRVPGASHEALAERPSQEAAEAGAILAWFGRYRTDAAGLRRPATAAPGG